jgi:hypothetical protein
MTSEPIWKLPAPSQEFNDGPQVLISPGRVTLRWDAETDTGAYEWSSASFVGVEHVEFTADSSCIPEQIDAYDRLVKIEPSETVLRLGGASAKFVQHFRIYFDGIGCLDVVAEDFLPPKP